MERYRSIEKIKFTGRVLRDAKDDFGDKLFFASLYTYVASEVAQRGPVAGIIYGASAAGLGYLMGADIRRHYKSRKEIENNAGPITHETAIALQHELDAMTYRPSGSINEETEHAVYGNKDGDRIFVTRLTEKCEISKPDTAKYVLHTYLFVEDGSKEIIYESSKPADETRSFTAYIPKNRNKGSEDSPKRTLAEFEGRQLIRIFSKKREALAKRSNK